MTVKGGLACLHQTRTSNQTLKSDKHKYKWNVNVEWSKYTTCSNFVHGLKAKSATVRPARRFSSISSLHTRAAVRFQRVPSGGPD